MVSLLVLLTGRAGMSGLLARALVHGARRVPLGQTLLIGGAGTVGVGILGWFLATPWPAVLSTQPAVPVGIVSGLVGVAAWRGGPRRRPVTPGREHRTRSGGWTGEPRYS